jgi:phenylpropionate dioxygenase-like ring-hydroxylating dioxygenase large terminal subunit
VTARTPLHRSPAPALGTAPIPKERYTTPEFARLERERLWPRVWLLAALARDLAAPGDWATFEIADESILLVRQPDGTIRGHHNVCMHRGNRLCEPGRGTARRFVCQYHGWRYGLDGALLQALDPHTFPQGCPPDALGLRPVRCETWAGFVFVALDAAAPPLREYLGVLPAHLDPYHFEDMALLDDYTIEIPCNWKTSLDAFNEAYHIAATHPDTLPINDDVDVPIDCYERHSRMILKLGVQSPRLQATGRVNGEIQRHFLARYGIDPATFTGGPGDVRPAIAAAVRSTLAPALGADVTDLHDAQLTDDFHYTLFPNVTFNLFGVSAWVFRHRPHPTDPHRMFFDFWDLLRAPAQAVRRPPHRHVVRTGDLTRERVSGGGKLLGQDLYNLPRIQAGMRSRGYTGLHLGDQEVRIRHFHRTLDGYLARS